MPQCYQLSALNKKKCQLKIQDGGDYGYETVKIMLFNASKIVIEILILFALFIYYNKCFVLLLLS